MRVSTAQQNEARQIEALEKYGIEKWFVEKISGKDTNRPRLQEMLGYGKKKRLYIWGLVVKDLYDDAEELLGALEVSDAFEKATWLKNESPSSGNLRTNNEWFSFYTMLYP